MSATGGSAARVAELKRLRPGFTPEWPAEERGPGAALDQALGRYLATLDHRLASAADRQQLALLDLLGVSLIPAQAARAPVVFTVGCRLARDSQLTLRNRRQRRSIRSLRLKRLPPCRPARFRSKRSRASD